MSYSGEKFLDIGSHNWDNLFSTLRHIPKVGKTLKDSFKTLVFAGLKKKRGRLYMVPIPLSNLADDTTLVGLTNNNDDSTHREDCLPSSLWEALQES